MESDKDVSNWLRYYEISAPLICLSELVSHDPVSFNYGQRLALKDAHVDYVLTFACLTTFTVIIILYVRLMSTTFTDPLDCIVGSRSSCGAHSLLQ